MSSPSPTPLPRVAITFCTQCKWMLRAAYFGQELLSTFGTSLGEVALIPATGGIFNVELTYKPVAQNTPPTTTDAASTVGAPAGDADENGDVEVKRTLIWDRKAEGGFPEAKVLKQRVRDCIEPKRDLGHSDVGGRSARAKAVEEGKAQDGGFDGAKEPEGDGKAVEEAKAKDCEDCR